VIALGTKQYRNVDPDKLDGAFARHVALASMYAVLASAGTAPALNYRGAIACGEFIIDGNFLLGSAIDTAAQHHEEPDAALVWLCPGETETKWRLGHAQAAGTSRALQCLPVEYDIPIKRKIDDSIVSTFHRGIALNPFAFGEAMPQYIDAIDGAMRTAFGEKRKDDVERKLQATIAFNQVAKLHWLGTRPQESA
jgi:hypothetical protein